MTKLFRHTILLMAAITMFAACEERAIPSDKLGTDGITQGRLTYDTIQNMREASVDTIDVTEAVRIGLELPIGNTSSKSYYVLGYVKGITTPFDPTYGNITIVISNSLQNRQMTCYRLKSFKGANFTDANQVQIGDIVVIYGQIQNRYGVPQLTQGCQLVTSDNPESGYIPGPVVLAKETFNEGIGSFSIVNKKAASADVWTHTPATDEVPGYMIADANINSHVEEAESWLVSPNMDLTRCTRGAQLSFSHNFRGDASLRADMLRVMISTDGGSNWKQLTLDNSMWNDGTKGQWVAVTLNLDAYKSAQTQIAFAYKSSTTTALKWRVQNIRVGEPEDVDTPK